MPSIIDYAKNSGEKKVLEEVKNTDGIKYVGRNDGKVVITFCGYRPNLSNGIIDTDVGLDVQQKALNKLDNMINGPVNPKMWSVAYVTPPKGV